MTTKSRMSIWNPLDSVLKHIQSYVFNELISMGLNIKAISTTSVDGSIPENDPENGVYSFMSIFRPDYSECREFWFSFIISRSGEKIEEEASNLYKCVMSIAIVATNKA